MSDDQKVNEIFSYIERLRARLDVLEQRKSPDSSTGEDGNEIASLKAESPDAENQKGASHKPEAEFSEIPEYSTYFPSEEGMNAEQLKFYQHLEQKLDRYQHVDVRGNISYLFTYVYKILDRWELDGYKYVYDRLIELAEEYYYEEKFPSYCWNWATDCLLGLGAYTRWLELTELADPEQLFSSGGYHSEHRCAVSYKLGLSPQAVDLYRASTFFTNPTETTKRNAEKYRDCLESVFEERAEGIGGWMNRYFTLTPDAHEISLRLFAGAPVSGMPESGVGYFPLSHSRPFMQEVSQAAREAENRLRDYLDLARIGEEWVTETELYRFIKESFPQTRVIHHGRPEWLGKQHLDIWIPRWCVAVEYHGRQHFEPVEFFGGVEMFEETKARDERKARLCEQKGVSLIIATEEDEFEDVVDQIQSYRPST